MSLAKEGDTVKVHYTGKLEDGIIFDSSDNREPLEFTIGSKQVIPGFETAIVDMDIGDKKTVEIAADDAYGQIRDELVFDIPKEKFAPDSEPKVGDKYNLTQENGGVVTVTVKSVEEKTISLDANHPLAGQKLIFEVELVEIV